MTQLVPRTTTVHKQPFLQIYMEGDTILTQYTVEYWSLGYINASMAFLHGSATIQNQARIKNFCKRNFDLIVQPTNSLTESKHFLKYPRSFPRLAARGSERGDCVQAPDHERGADHLLAHPAHPDHRVRHQLLQGLLL